MLFTDLLSWWYSQGWQQVAATAAQRMRHVANAFSVPILIRTLWSPWRRIVTYPGASIDAKIRALADNMVSRIIGFTVRLLVLLTSAVLLLFMGILGVVSLVAWPLVPLLVLVCIAKGLGL